MNQEQTLYPFIFGVVLQNLPEYITKEIIYEYLMRQYDPHKRNQIVIRNKSYLSSEPITSFPQKRNVYQETQKDKKKTLLQEFVVVQNNIKEEEAQLQNKSVEERREIQGRITQLQSQLSEIRRKLDSDFEREVTFHEKPIGGISRPKKITALVQLNSFCDAVQFRKKFNFTKILDHTLQISILTPYIEDFEQAHVEVFNIPNTISHKEFDEIVSDYDHFEKRLKEKQLQENSLVINNKSIQEMLREYTKYEFYVVNTERHEIPSLDKNEKNYSYRIRFQHMTWALKFCMDVLSGEFKIGQRKETNKWEKVDRLNLDQYEVILDLQVSHPQYQIIGSNLYLYNNNQLAYPQELFEDNNELNMEREKIQQEILEYFKEFEVFRMKVQIDSLVKKPQIFIAFSKKEQTEQAQQKVTNDKNFKYGECLKFLSKGDLGKLREEKRDSKVLFLKNLRRQVNFQGKVQDLNEDILKQVIEKITDKQNKSIQVESIKIQQPGFSNIKTNFATVFLKEEGHLEELKDVAKRQDSDLFSMFDTTDNKKPFINLLHHREFHQEHLVNKKLRSRLNQNNPMFQSNIALQNYQAIQPFLNAPPGMARSQLYMPFSFSQTNPNLPPGMSNPMGAVRPFQQPIIPFGMTQPISNFMQPLGQRPTSQQMFPIQQNNQFYNRQPQYPNNREPFQQMQQPFQQRNYNQNYPVQGQQPNRNQFQQPNYNFNRPQNNQRPPFQQQQQQPNFNQRRPPQQQNSYPQQQQQQPRPLQQNPNFQQQRGPQQPINNNNFQQRRNPQQQNQQQPNRPQGQPVQTKPQAVQINTIPLPVNLPFRPGQQPQVRPPQQQPPQNNQNK